MIKQICEVDNCCGCMACVNICPLKCINMRSNKRGEEIPFIDDEKCISCNLCKKVCPENGENITLSVNDVFAAWSNREKIRKTSASGGIASEIYHISSADKCYVGCCLDDKHRCRYHLVQGKKDTLGFQNSKYVYSYMGQIYGEIEILLREGKDIVFIGLPCHAAGLKNI